MSEISSFFQARLVNKYFKLVLLASSTLHAAESEQLIEIIKITSGQILVVAEGNFKARSIGSYSARIYDVALSEDESTFFSAGQYRARDGEIEKLVFADDHGDKQLEVVVTMRSVGAGGYISAHAFLC